MPGLRDPGGLVAAVAADIRVVVEEEAVMIAGVGVGVEGMVVVAEDMGEAVGVMAEAVAAGEALLCGVSCLFGRKGGVD